MKSLYIALLAALLTAVSLSSCRQDEIVFPPEDNPVTNPNQGDIYAFYLLNEGNMGSNKASLDLFNYSTGTYTRNIYSQANPDVPKELGDVGNDLKIYGSKLYAVINCSNKVEVMHSDDARRITKIDIPNCRFIDFDGQYAYVTSYAGPVKIDPDYKQRGYVAKIDTTTLAVVDTCVVGYQPDQLAVLNGKIYVANSGGYRVPNYENTLSVIDINTFKEEKRIPIDINLSRVIADKNNHIWVVSRGDYFTNTPKLFCYDPASDSILKTIEIGASSMWLDDSRIYIVGTNWSYETMSNTTTFAVVDIDSMQIISSNFITDGTESKIKVPYCVAVNPDTKEIYVSDARTYVNPGTLYAFNPDGTLNWSIRTGDIPSKIAFIRRKADKK